MIVNVLTIERRMAASLRGRQFPAVASWTPADPYTITLTYGHETWTLSREAVFKALAGERMDRAAFNAAEIEIIRDTDDSDDHIEVTRYFHCLRPVPVWFTAADWEQLLADTVDVVPFGHERDYICWTAEFGWLKEASV